MTPQKEILDSDLNKSNLSGQEELTSKIYLRSVIYFNIMAIGGCAYYWGLPQYSHVSIYALLCGSIIFIFQGLVISLILEVFRFFRRKHKFKKRGIKLNVDPFWFQVVEGGFGIWILFMAVQIVFYLVKTLM